jgi:hypothetical protein
MFTCQLYFIYVHYPEAVLPISTIPFVFTAFTTHQKLVHFLFLSEADSGGVMGRTADS